MLVNTCYTCCSSSVRISLFSTSMCWSKRENLPVMNLGDLPSDEGNGSPKICRIHLDRGSLTLLPDLHSERPTKWQKFKQKVTVPKAKHMLIESFYIPQATIAQECSVIVHNKSRSSETHITQNQTQHTCIAGHSCIVHHVPPPCTTKEKTQKLMLHFFIHLVRSNTLLWVSQGANHGSVPGLPSCGNFFEASTNSYVLSAW